jgi:hypothetical protein
MSTAGDFRKNAEECRQFAARAIKAVDYARVAPLLVEATATKKREGT